MKKSSIIVYVGLITSVFIIILLGTTSTKMRIPLDSIPEGLSREEITKILSSEQITYNVDAQGNIETSQSEALHTQLLLTGLKAIGKVHGGKSVSDAVGELIIQRFLKKKVDGLLSQLVGSGNYISEVYVSPSNSSIPVNRSIKPNDLVTYFLKSPGIKRIYLRVIIDSEALESKQLDQQFVEGRISRQFHSLLYDLKGVRLTEEFVVIPFHGTGLSSIALSDSTHDQEASLIGKLFVPLLLTTAFTVTWLLFLLLRNRKKTRTEEEEIVAVSPDAEIDRIWVSDTQEGESYIPLDSLPSEVVSNFTSSTDIGNLLLLLTPKEGANFIQMLPFEQQVKSIGECLGFEHLDVVERERLLIKISLKLRVEVENAQFMKRNSIRHVAKILNQLHPATGKRILQDLHQIDAVSIMRLKNEYFVLATIVPLSDEAAKYLARNGEFIDLFLAVHDSDSATRSRVMSLATGEERNKISKSVEDFEKVSPEIVQAAQLRITKRIVEFERKQAQEKTQYIPK